MIGMRWSASETCRILRIKEKPLECGPEEGSPSTTSPARVFEPSMMASFSTDADAKAREIVVRAVIHAGHLGGFAADQRAAGLHAALDDARDDPFADIDIEFAAGEVVQEEQRLGALNDDVVDAHGHQIDAHPVVPMRVDSQAQFGADAIGSRYQHGLAIAVQGHLDQGTKAADARPTPPAASSASPAV